jgi:hypothetical protein
MKKIRYIKHGATDRSFLLDAVRHICRNVEFQGRLKYKAEVAVWRFFVLAAQQIK